MKNRSENKADKGSAASAGKSRNAIGIAAVFMMVMSLTIRWYADDLGFAEDHAQIVAGALMLFGVVDGLIYSFWDRLFPAGRKQNR